MSIETIIALMGVFFGGGALASLITFFVTRHDKQKAEEDKLKAEAEETAKALRELAEAFAAFATTQSEANEKQNAILLALGHDRIIHFGLKFIERGYITADEYGSLKAIADAYRAMGGNGEAKKVMNEVDKLPIRG